MFSLHTHLIYFVIGVRFTKISIIISDDRRRQLGVYGRCGGLSRSRERTRARLLHGKAMLQPRKRRLLVVLPPLSTCHCKCTPRQFNLILNYFFSGFLLSTILKSQFWQMGYKFCSRNSIPPTTTIENLKIKAKMANEEIYVDVGFWGGVVPGNEVVINIHYGNIHKIWKIYYFVIQVLFSSKNFEIW